MNYPAAFPVYQVDTIRDLLFQIAERYGDRTALAGKRAGRYEPVSYRELRDRVEALATALLHRGFGRGDRIALLAENRPEWAVTYFAVVSLGATIVPLDRDLTAGELSHLLRFSEARALFASSDHLRMLDAGGGLPSLPLLVRFDEAVGIGEQEYSDLLREGREAVGEDKRRFLEVNIDPDLPAALIFTSGTTGAPKGVVLSHRNIVSNVTGVSYHVAINHDDVLLSVLPLHHTYEATAGFLTALYQGASVYYAESLRRVADNLREVRPTVLLGVPALFEAMYRRIEAGIVEAGRGKFRLARLAAGIGEKVLGSRARRRIFSRIHERFGGRLRLLISGGAAIDPRVVRGFRELGIDFLQGYGLTEYSPIISVNRVDHYKDGSVGLPLPHTEVRIVDDEIVVRGPCLMQGYYKNAEATAEVIREGWLYTGDLGYLDKDGFLFISGRRKSVIVTPNGKNVYPEELESLLNQSPYILESLVWGGPDPDPSKTEVQAIIVPDTQALDAEFGPDGWDETKLQSLIAGEVQRVNRQLARYKRIRRFVLRREEFEKTTTRKIKRYLYTARSQVPR
ncbi:MAG: AMP-dependent synthetase/ligase [Acidobacteriota bacterium]